MASTPSPGARRVHTPPSPKLGSFHDDYQPYSPRRSQRSTAHSNPYSSFNSDISPIGARSVKNVTPPATVRKTRFARAPAQLSSPPSSPLSPVSPVKQRIGKTPRKQTTRLAGGAAESDFEHPSTSLSPHMPNHSMLPTPAKTPNKRHNTVINSTARVLNFQPDNLNDIMPSPRSKMKRHVRLHSTQGFDLYEGDAPPRASEIPIFTDSSARVPQLDPDDDNPFIGSKKTEPKNQRKTKNAQRIEKATRNDEGVVYVFRGKKIFRKFQDSDNEDSSVSSNSFGSAREQRMLRRQIGAAASRPLTRSAIKPRLLFPSEEQIREREIKANEIDEEAMTDIEGDAQQVEEGPSSESRSSQMAPTGSSRTTRSGLKSTVTPPSPNGDDESEMEGVTPTATHLSPSSKKSSPFDSWPRTKAGRKRAGDAVKEAVAGKRVRHATSNRAI